MKKIGIFASGTGTNFEALASSDEIKSLADIKLWFVISQVLEL